MGINFAWFLFFEKIFLAVESKLCVYVFDGFFWGFCVFVLVGSLGGSLRRVSVVDFRWFLFWGWVGGKVGGSWGTGGRNVERIFFWFLFLRVSGFAGLFRMFISGSFFLYRFFFLEFASYGFWLRRDVFDRRFFCSCSYNRNVFWKISFNKILVLILEI